MKLWICLAVCLISLVWADAAQAGPVRNFLDCAFSRVGAAVEGVGDRIRARRANRAAATGRDGRPLTLFR